MSHASSERWDLPTGEVYVRHVPGHSARGGFAVFVHGLGGSSLNWVDLMPLLAPDVEGLALDLPGFGASPPPRDGDYSPAGHARAVARTVRHWQSVRGDDRPVHVFGNSMGGAVALQLAAREPGLVASLTLISPALPTRRTRRGNAHLPVVAVPGLGESLLRRYRQVSAEARVAATLDACFVDVSSVSPALREALTAEVIARDAYPYVGEAFLSSLRGLLRGFADPTPQRPWALARRITRPVLALYGEDDVLVHPSGARRAAREFPDAEVVLLSRTGHAAQMEHPELVADLWRRVILDRAPRPAVAP
ncbi:MAG: alpha/beta fold hydrolase [Actinomycetota bacterium]